MKTKKNFVIIMILVLFVGFIVGCEKRDENEIKVGVSSSSFENKNYEEVISELNEIGFTNIETQEIDDLVLGWLTKDGAVDQVSIDGNTSFDSGTYFNKDVKIIISYHTFPKDVAKKDDENNSQDYEVAKLIYDEAVDKTPLDISKNLSEEGFEAKFIHEITNEDFTTSIQFSSDPKDEDSFIPWIITKLDTFKPNEKVASFYISTKENMEYELEKQNMEKVLTSKLSPSVAWGTFMTFGESEFPYGFKLKISTGTETVIDEDTWFLKARCEVKNASGTWNKKVVCEAKVTGTSDSAKIIYFDAY